MCSTGSGPKENEFKFVWLFPQLLNTFLYYVVVKASPNKENLNFVQETQKMNWAHTFLACFQGTSKIVSKRWKWRKKGKEGGGGVPLWRSIGPSCRIQGLELQARIEVSRKCEPSEDVNPSCKPTSPEWSTYKRANLQQNTPKHLDREILLAVIRYFFSGSEINENRKFCRFQNTKNRTKAKQSLPSSKFLACGHACDHG